MSDDTYLCMYAMAQRRYQMVTDKVLESLASGVVPDVLELLRAVCEIAENCDYIDDESVVLYERAKKRWSDAHVLTTPELRVHAERVINASQRLLYEYDHMGGPPVTVDRVIAAVEEAQW